MYVLVAMGRETVVLPLPFQFWPKFKADHDFESALFLLI
jgi:hypothetical protein